MPTINTVLIANRGEIAMRVIATCRVLGVRTVTVYSEADRALPHALAGDVGVLLEGVSLAETYLNQELILAIARETGADAIHPGYGFLSENAEFAARVEQAGLCFIGPPSDVIALMGDKVASRQAMEALGVPLVPGYHGEAQDETTLLAEAERIGFPVLLKAAAGGGGKGMRVVERAEDMAGALSAAKSEARHAFGNDRVLLEKYLEQPRHVEVQVFSDGHGNHLHLYERDCSIQRRHQKIVEESPAPGLDAATRQALAETAVRITEHIDYRGAGTVEFILDASGAFYFLEMNTRLQVEHPVTEMITGADLVAWQLAVAEGNPLPVRQDAIQQRGHAIEVRLYAEDPDRGFLPTTGVLTHIGASALPNLRLENGYTAGNAVTVAYDPMLAKLAAWGTTREEARRVLLTGLEDVCFAGVKTNRDYLRRVLLSEAFIHGDVSTDFVERCAGTLQPEPLSEEVLAMAAAAFLSAKPLQAWGAGGSQTVTEHTAWTHSDTQGRRYG